MYSILNSLKSFFPNKDKIISYNLNLFCSILRILQIEHLLLAKSKLASFQCIIHRCNFLGSYINKYSKHYCKYWSWEKAKDKLVSVEKRTTEKFSLYFVFLERSSTKIFSLSKCIYDLRVLELERFCQIKSNKSQNEPRTLEWQCLWNKNPLNLIV